MHQSKVIFECSSYQVKEAIIYLKKYPLFRLVIGNILCLLRSFRDWKIEVSTRPYNRIAELIATTVTRDHMYKSYIAQEGLSWLQNTLFSKSSSEPEDT